MSEEQKPEVNEIARIVYHWIYNGDYEGRDWTAVAKSIIIDIERLVLEGKIKALNQAHRLKGLADVDNETDETIDEIVDELESELQALKGEKK